MAEMSGVPFIHPAPIHKVEALSHHGQKHWLPSSNLTIGLRVCAQKASGDDKTRDEATILAQWFKVLAKRESQFLSTESSKALPQEVDFI